MFANASFSTNSFNTDSFLFDVTTVAVGGAIGYSRDDKDKFESMLNNNTLLIIVAAIEANNPL